MTVYSDTVVDIASRECFLSFLERLEMPRSFLSVRNVITFLEVIPHLDYKSVKILKIQKQFLLQCSGY